MNISLPDALESFVDDQVSARGFSTSSEYVRELIRKDRDRQCLRGLLLEGAASPQAVMADADYFDQLRNGVRERARRDIDETVAHYLAEVGPTAALAFIDALEDARRRIGEQPANGSPRYAHELDIPGLRFRSAGKFPYLNLLRREGRGSRCLARSAWGAGCSDLDAGAVPELIRKAFLQREVPPDQQRCPNRMPFGLLGRSGGGNRGTEYPLRVDPVSGDAVVDECPCEIGRRCGRFGGTSGELGDSTSGLGYVRYMM